MDFHFVRECERGRICRDLRGVSDQNMHLAIRVAKRAGHTQLANKLNMLYKVRNHLDQTDVSVVYDDMRLQDANIYLEVLVRDLAQEYMRQIEEGLLPTPTTIDVLQHRWNTYVKKKKEALKADMRSLFGGFDVIELSTMEPTDLENRIWTHEFERMIEDNIQEAYTNQIKPSTLFTHLME